MNTPSPKYFCPRCRASYEVPHNYCGRCGADMRRASGLEYAATGGVEAIDDGDSGSDWSAQSWDEARDRRASDSRDQWLGRVIDGRYRVIEVIGSGGMGVVYKVEHQRMSKIAAMKVLHHDLARQAEVIDRFRREAEAVSRLNHPNTVQVFDFGTAGDALYLIMEYVRGQDLGRLVRRDGPLPFARAAPLFAQICATLAEAHELGVVHRDLKPENILVTRTHGGRDFVKVLDFGLAKLAEREDAASVTERGSIVGTPYFMSPEQIRGEDVDHRSDLYSLGALMYRVLTGEHPYTAKTPVGVLTKHLTAALIPPSVRCPELGIDPRIDEIVERAMSKQREDRYESAGALLEALEAAALELGDDSGRGWLAGGWRPTASSSSSTPPRARPSTDEIDYGIDSDVRLRRSDLDAFEVALRRRRWLLALGAPLLLAAAAGALVYYVTWSQAQPLTAEREPNDRLEQANVIAAGTPVRGFIGRRLSKTQPDIDYYRITPAARPGETVTVTVTGLPNIDLELSLYDATGRVLERADEGGVGAGEAIRRRRASGVLYVSVTEAMPAGPRLPTENVSDAYLLEARFEPEDPAWESEPNESDSDANTLRAGLPVSGWLDRRADIDAFRFDGAAGEYVLSIEGAADAAIEWRVDDQAPRRERRAMVRLESGSVVRLQRADRDLPGGRALPGADEPYTLLVAPPPTLPSPARGKGF